MDIFTVKNNGETNKIGRALDPRQRMFLVAKDEPKKRKNLNVLLTFNLLQFSIYKHT